MDSPAPPVSTGEESQRRTWVVVAVAAVVGMFLLVGAAVAIFLLVGRSSGDGAESGDFGELTDEFDVRVGLSNDDSSYSRSSNAGAFITNRNEDDAAYEVEVMFNFTDESGAILDTEIAYLPYIPPGGTAPAAVTRYIDGDGESAAAVDVSVSARLRSDDGLAAAGVVPLEIEPPQFEENALGGTSLKLLVANRSTDGTSEYSSGACVGSKGGEVVGGVSVITGVVLGPGKETLAEGMLFGTLAEPGLEFTCAVDGSPSTRGTAEAKSTTVPTTMVPATTFPNVTTLPDDMQARILRSLFDTLSEEEQTSFCDAVRTLGPDSSADILLQAAPDAGVSKEEVVKYIAVWCP